MKNFYCLIVLLLTFQTNAQTWSTFFETCDANHSNTTVNGLRQTNDGGYILPRSIDCDPSDFVVCPKAYITKFDGSGNIEWNVNPFDACATTPTDSKTFYDVVETVSGYMAVFTKTGFPDTSGLLFLDANGVTTGRVDFDHTLVFDAALYKISSSEYITVLGGSNKVFIIKTDQNGAILNQDTVAISGVGTFLKMEGLLNGNIVLEAKYSIHLLDDDGNVLSENLLPNHDVQSFHVDGDHFFVLHEGTGDDFFYTSYDQTASLVNQVTTDNIAPGTNYGKSSDNQYMLLLDGDSVRWMDHNGVIVTSHFIPHTGYMEAVIEVNDEYYVIAEGDSLKAVTHDPLGLISSVKEGHNLQEVQLFPNPAKNMLTIKTSGSITAPVMELTILDVSGRLVYKEQLNNVISINISNLAPGLYFCNVLTGDGMRYSAKFFKN